MSTSRSAASPLTYSPPGLGSPLAARDESGIVGSSTAMKRLRQQVRRIGPHFRTVLVSGEAGGGKGVGGPGLHRRGAGADRPYVGFAAACAGEISYEWRGS